MKQSICLLIFLVGSSLGADQPPKLADRQLQTMQHQLSNQDQELSILKQKIYNFENILDSTHKEISGLVSATKASQKKSTSTFETRIKTAEKNLEKLVSDLKAFKKQANDVAASTAEIQKKIKEQEEITSLQAEQIKDLENALRSLASAMQTKSAKSGKTHIVKSGESLEKIAKEYGTSIDAIRAENGLSKDTIHPGQKLAIP